MNALDDFLRYIKDNHNVKSKINLTDNVKRMFNLTRDRSVYFCNNFAVRFSQSKGNGFSNTVLSLSCLHKYDRIPFLVCLVTPNDVKVFLANTTFLSKISHSSHELRIDNIKGSFNGSDIIKQYNGIDNNIDNIRRLFAYHIEVDFNDNLERLVEATNNINGVGSKFVVTEVARKNILASVRRAISFCSSNNYGVLLNDLNERVEQYKDAIFVSSHIENVKLRGSIIEYLIAGDNNELKSQISTLISREYDNIPAFQLYNGLGDYMRIFDDTHTETDIKTKVIMLNSNPKAYNIDKFLEYHAEKNTVFMFYFVGIDENGIFKTSLISVYQKCLLSHTSRRNQWAGRNSRGVTQFEGHIIHQLLENPNNDIDVNDSINRLNEFIEI